MDAAGGGGTSVWGAVVEGMSGLSMDGRHSSMGLRCVRVNGIRSRNSKGEDKLDVDERQVEHQATEHQAAAFHHCEY